MTSLVVPGVRQISLPARVRRLPVPVLAMGAATFVLRLAFIGGPMSADEGGFLVVAHQWRAGGGSLYGHYWVDRPPLLLEVFRVADHLGGLTALRLIASVGAGVTVVLLGYTVNRIVGERAATWAAVVATGLLAAPIVGATNGDGEVIALPFLALGITATVVALTTPLRSRAAWAAAIAGFAAVSAVLVKQNMLDVFVFTAAIGLLTWRSGHVERTRLRRLAAPWVAGTAASLLLILGGAALRGTSPGGVFYAMYPFRLTASKVIQAEAAGADLHRMVRLVIVALLFGAPVLVAALGALLVRRQVTRVHPLAVPLAGATLALSAYAGMSIALGGNYWLHYLVQLVVPASLAAGLLVASVPRLGTRLVALAAVVGAVGWVSGLTTRTSASGTVIGHEIRQVARPGDTIASLLGGAEIVETSGLRAPYTYLWSLPAQTLDHRFRLLRSTLSGPDAPTWVVVRAVSTAGELDKNGVGAVLRARYRFVGMVCNRPVYLRNDATRATPPDATHCSGPDSTLFASPAGGIR